MSALLSSFAASLQDEEEQARTTQSDLAFTPRPSLWEHVSSLLQPAERSEAKLVIGSSAILDNQQLHDEVRSLIDIVAYLQTTQPPLTATAASHSSSSVVASWPTPNGVPPLRLRGFEADRTEHLKEEIAQLIAAIRSKARQRGDNDTSRIWSPRSEREKSIVAMVEREGGASARSSSRSSRCSTARPSTASTARSASHVSASVSPSRPASSSVSSLSSSVVSLSSLSIFTLDSAVTRIQAALREEREELLRDIDYLRSTIEDEEWQADERRKEEHEVAASEIELRALNKQLRAAVAEDERTQCTRRLLNAVPDKARFKAAHTPLARAAGATAEEEQRESEQPQSAQAVMQVQQEESVQSMLSSVDDLEAAFFHYNDSQPRSNSAAQLASSGVALTASRTKAPPAPPSAASLRASANVFTIRPPSPSSSSLSSAASSLRIARASSLPRLRAADSVGLKPLLASRMKLLPAVS